MTRYILRFYLLDYFIGITICQSIINMHLIIHHKVRIKKNDHLIKNL